MIGAQEFLDCRPYATTVFTGLDDALTAKSISRRIDEFIGTTADSLIGQIVRFSALFLSATFKSSFQLFDRNGFRIQPPRRCPASSSGASSNRCDVVQHARHGQLELIKVYARSISGV